MNLTQITDTNTTTTETLHHQQRDAVHRNAAIFELLKLLTISCTHKKNFMMIN